MNKLKPLKYKTSKKLKNDALSIFCPKCKKKCALRESPLDLKSVVNCVICVENNDTKECTSISGLKVFYQEEGVPKQVYPICFIVEKWKQEIPV